MLSQSVRGLLRAVIQPELVVVGYVIAKQLPLVVADLTPSSTVKPLGT